jgi:hypothetical protein
VPLAGGPCRRAGFNFALTEERAAELTADAALSVPESKADDGLARPATSASE